MIFIKDYKWNLNSFHSISVKIDRSVYSFSLHDSFFFSFCLPPHIVSCFELVIKTKTRRTPRNDETIGQNVCLDTMSTDKKLLFVFQNLKSDVQVT